LEQRLAGKRDPRLRKRVPRERIVTFWAGSDGGHRLLKGVGKFQKDLTEQGPYVHPAPRARQRSSEKEGSV